MKAILKKMSFIVIAAAIMLPAMAQDFTQPRDPAIQSQKIMTTGAAYSGTVYEPFNNTTPAEYNPVASAPSNAPSGPRRSFDTGADVKPSEDYPIGDAMLPLLLMALAFGGVVALRKRRNSSAV